MKSVISDSRPLEKDGKKIDAAARKLLSPIKSSFVLFFLYCRKYNYHKFPWNIEILYFLKVLYITRPYVTLSNAVKTVIMISYPVISGLCFLDAMWGGVLNYKLALANYIHKLYRRIKYWNFIYQNWSTTKGTNTTNTAEKFSLANTGAASIGCISVC